jgi:hypothetical protein
LKRGDINSRSWNAAIQAVQQNIFAMGASPGMSDEKDRVLTEVFNQCEELRAKKYLKAVATNQDLAKKYAISPRTVTNWRKKGCPFDKGQWQVLNWMFGRRYLPQPARQKFTQQLVASLT